MTLAENFLVCSEYKQKSHNLACHRNCDRVGICVDLRRFDESLSKRLLARIIENSGIVQLKLPEWKK